MTPYRPSLGMRQRFGLWLSDSLWYKKKRLAWLLYPCTLVYQLGFWLHKQYCLRYRRVRLPVPLIVVGNLSVGGTGKTPVVIALAKALKQAGIQVGIISRGYQSKLEHYPHEVGPKDQARLVGDEPLLMAEKTGCPVVIAPERLAAARYLIEKKHCQLLLSDDGLQHYALTADIEIAVIDGLRGLGNGLCLPAGPLREPAKRLASTDLTLVNGGSWPGAYPMQLTLGQAYCPNSHSHHALQNLPQPVAAVAGIGNPGRFFHSLSLAGIDYRPYPFPDHYAFKAEDLNFPEKYLVMTEKDAVKCREFLKDTHYVLPVTAEFDPRFWQAFWALPPLRGLKKHATETALD